MTVKKRRPEFELSGKQRRFLRGLAHELDPVVQVGKEGITGGVIDAVQQTLTDHELVKVRVLEGAPLDREAAGEALASACGAHVIGEIGRIVMLYRMHDEKPTIPLPRR